MWYLGYVYKKNVRHHELIVKSINSYLFYHYLCWKVKFNLRHFSLQVFQKCNLLQGLILPMDPAIPLWGLYPKELKAKTHTDYLYTPILKAALFTTAKRWKQPKCPSTEERGVGGRSISTMEYHSVLKRKEILTHATTWLNLENVVLSKTPSHKRTNTIRMVPLTSGA